MTVSQLGGSEPRTLYKKNLIPGVQVFIPTKQKHPQHLFTERLDISDLIVVRDYG